MLFCTDKRLKPFFEENAHGIKSINWPQKCRISDETGSFLSQYPPALCYKNYTHCNKRKSRSSAGFPTFDTYYIGTISPDLTPKQNFFEFRLPVTNSIPFVTNQAMKKRGERCAGGEKTGGRQHTSKTALGAAGDSAVYLTEKEGGVDTSNYKLEGKKNADAATSQDGDWTGLVKMGKMDTANMGTALTLQIGDTADSYNQMSVKVGDMHTKALGIDGINIGDQTDAGKAIQTIRDAINQVSSVRGDLGAIQNRLEHTGNNLSVMAENIQDAESTIRDTDVAEEMMSYVKNNILVQSAQAMLAQANQVPQGVLQLLG